MTWCEPASILSSMTNTGSGYLRWGIDCDGSEALLKPVGAVAGDRYAITEAGIVVNGELVPDTRPLRADNAGRSMTWSRRRRPRRQ